MSDETNNENTEIEPQIGHWDIYYLAPTNKSRTINTTKEEMPDIPRQMITKNEYQVVEKDKFENENLAYYDAGDNKNIIMYTSKDKKDQTRFSATDANEYAKKNPLAQYSIWLHELGHYADDKYFHISGLDNTPVNAARFDRLTERKSIAIQYLAVADKYNRMKKDGITEFEYNGQKIPLEDTLNLCPGLREVFEKYGTDIDNKQTSRAIVEAAEKFFENYHQKYDNQAYQKYCRSYDNQKAISISTKMDLAQKEDKKYNTVADNILKKVNIGERYIDLSHCKDLIDTMSAQDVAQLVQSKNDAKYPLVTSEQLLEVYNYLDKKGLKTDDEKELYLAEKFYSITGKEETADAELRDILLKTSPENQTIIYDDGSTEDFSKKKEIEQKLLAGQLKKDAQQKQEEKQKQIENLQQTTQPLQNNNVAYIKENTEQYLSQSSLPNHR